VGLLKLYPGIPQAMIDSVLHTPGLKALVLETFGAGNASTKPDFIESLRKAIEKGMIILDVTQCVGGSVELGRYQTSVQLQKIGVISGEDITTEAALAKLMHLLGQDLSATEIRPQLAVSLRGEISV
jgi:L-asparaginase